MMHYSGAKSAAEKMMMSAPKIEDFTRNYSRPGESADTIDHEAYGRAISGHAASMASGSWMTSKTSAGGRDGEAVYRHPHLAKLAEQGYTYNDIQAAGNQLGIKSFNSENDANAIGEFLDNHYNPPQPEKKKKKPKEKVKPEKPAVGS